MKKSHALIMLPLAIGIGPRLDAQGASPAGPIELWNGFTTASTKAEIKAFKAKQPKHKVEVYSGCLAEMGYRYNEGRLVTIIFLGQDGTANCFARMRADFLRDRGEAEIQATTFGGVIGFGVGGRLDTTSTATMMIWRQGEKKTKLVKSPGNGYNLIFTVRPDKYLY